MWASNDFSSQEPRLLSALCQSALIYPEPTRWCMPIRTIPNTDFHQMVADMAGIKRKAAKTIGLGLMYGMGKNKLAAAIGSLNDEASELIDQFHRNVPFLKGTVNAVMKRIDHPCSRRSNPDIAGAQVPLPSVGTNGVGSQQGTAPRASSH
jgi:hypothetical protein